VGELRHDPVPTGVGCVWAGPGVGPSCKREGERMASGPGCNSNKIQNNSNPFQLGLNQH
jgi:hypothetical protein